MSMAIAIASIALVPLMTNEAFAYNYAYANTSMTYCNNASDYKTHVSQSTGTSSITVQIQVPGYVCGDNFVSGSVTVKDGSNNQCSFTLSSSNGQQTKSCGGNVDVGDTTVWMSVSLDYEDGRTINYTQNDSTT